MGFLGWRQAMSNEEWVSWGAPEDEAWYDRVQADFGVDAHPREPSAAGPAGRRADRRGDCGGFGRSR